MNKTIGRLSFVLFVLIMSVYVMVPLATVGYAADNATSAEQVQQTAISFGNSTDPVAVVTGSSEMLGFNPKLDAFTLIKQDGAQAIVQVTHNGANFEVILESSPDGSWHITAMNTSA